MKLMKELGICTSSGERLHNSSKDPIYRYCAQSRKAGRRPVDPLSRLRLENPATERYIRAMLERSIEFVVTRHSWTILPRLHSQRMSLCGTARNCTTAAKIAEPAKVATRTPSYWTLLLHKS
jgi:hypothetical protein